MTNKVQVVGVKRKVVDTEKLALAFLLFARSLQEQADQSTSTVASDESSKSEAA